MLVSLRESCGPAAEVYLLRGSAVSLSIPPNPELSVFIGNAVSKCAFYCSPNCVSASVRKRYTIHIITANYWHYTSGTLVTQNAHLLTLPTIKYGSEIKIPGKCFFVVQVLLFLLRPEILRVCSGQLEQFRLERAIMGSDFVKNFMTYITVIISELQRNCEKK